MSLADLIPEAFWPQGQALLAALWGGSFLFMRVAVPHLGAVPAAVGRGLFSSLGLAVALSENRDTADALRFANAAAALSVTKLGAQTSAPWRAEVDAYCSFLVP